MFQAFSLRVHSSAPQPGLREKHLNQSLSRANIYGIYQGSIIREDLLVFSCVKQECAALGKIH